jgi:hypothetical protein
MVKNNRDVDDFPTRMASRKFRHCANIDVSSVIIAGE